MRRKSKHATAVENGVAYLDAYYPGWWEKVDLALLNMYSVEKHVLRYATGKLVYETVEFVMWPFAKQVAHGFALRAETAEWEYLTQEWMFRISEIKTERK